MLSFSTTPPYRHFVKVEPMHILQHSTPAENVYEREREGSTMDLGFGERGLTQQCLKGGDDGANDRYETP